MLSGVSLALIVVGWFAFVATGAPLGTEIEVAWAAAEQSAIKLEENQRELEKLNQRLFRQARVDPLTGLSTRLSFNEDAPMAADGHFAPPILRGHVRHRFLQAVQRQPRASGRGPGTAAVAEAIRGSILDGDTVIAWAGRSSLWS